jgi:hypothetical protein
VWNMASRVEYNVVIRRFTNVIKCSSIKLMARDRAVELWLRNQVAPAYDALKTDPSRAVSVKQVRARLAAEQKRVRAKR